MNYFWEVSDKTIHCTFEQFCFNRTLVQSAKNVMTYNTIMQKTYFKNEVDINWFLKWLELLLYKSAY